MIDRQESQISGSEQRDDQTRGSETHFLPLMRINGGAREREEGRRPVHEKFGALHFCEISPNSLMARASSLAAFPLYISEGVAGIALIWLGVNVSVRAPR